MVNFNTIQKVILLGVIVAAVPVVALNMLMPRLAIADSSKMTLKLIDITVENFTSGKVNGHGPTNTTTLDLWLQVGLPVKNDSLKSVRSQDVEWDTSYYLDGDITKVNTVNLKDPTENIFVPQINITAKYNGNVVGTGGTVKVYQLNATHPVEIAHIYLNCSREADGGFMYMFNQITVTGGLDKLLLSMLGGKSEDAASALLGGLSLSLTAFAGSAPLTLSLSTSFFTSELPGIPVSSALKSGISPAAANEYPFIHYDPKRNLKDFGTMTRFSDQLGFSGSDTSDILLGAFGFEGVDITNLIPVLLSDLSMLFTYDNLFNDYYNFSMGTKDSWWIEPKHDIHNGTAYNNATHNDLDYSTVTSMQDRLASAIAWFKAQYDPDNQIIDPVASDGSYDKTLLDAAIAAAITAEHGINTTREATMQTKWNGYTDGSNQSSWYWRMFKNSTQLDIITLATFFGLMGGTPANPYPAKVFNTRLGTNITVDGIAPATSGIPLLTLFELFHANDDTIGDLFRVLGRTVPQVLTGLLFGRANVTSYVGNNSYGPEPGSYNSRNGGVVVIGSTSYNPSFSGIASQSILLVVVLIAFLIVFLLLVITKGTVSINRREFLGREDVQRNINAFIKQVEQLGGKVSVQNAESLVIRAFRIQGTIEKAPDVERRAKTYVENQKLLVTLQSRASRAYVAQKFKDCIAAIEKMIDIARKLEDQTLVANYEDNLAKVVKLLRRKGISVSTKMRVEEGAAAGSDVEKLGAYKKDLIDLQNKASKLFAERNWPEAKNCIKDMLAIAKKIQDPVLIRNYEANLRKIISMEKGGTA